jgi:hypothetical protein
LGESSGNPLSGRRANDNQITVSQESYLQDFVGARLIDRFRVTDPSYAVDCGHFFGYAPRGTAPVTL